MEQQRIWDALYALNSLIHAQKQERAVDGKEGFADPELVAARNHLVGYLPTA